MSHEPLGFVDGEFKIAQVQSPTVDEGAFASVSTSRRAEYLRYQRSSVYYGHRIYRT